jgi:hypothetical protein
MGVPLETKGAAVQLPAECVIEAPESVLSTGSSETAPRTGASFVLLPAYVPPTDALSRWLEAYRDEISSKLLRHLARYLARAREGADWPAVERTARALLELDPLNETATLGLAEAMARTGSKHKAMELLHAFADDVGQSHSSLALPSRLLKRRIAEEVQHFSSGSSRSPLVGRATELRALTDAWAHARRGRCMIAAITGEKSIGKSRVLEEFAELVRLDGSGLVLTARVKAADCARPMSVFSDLSAPLLALPGAAGCNPDSLPHLRRLRGTDRKADTEQVEIDPFLPEGATRAAVVDLFDSVASERPLLICIDDADYLDNASRELLASLPELAASVRVLVVVAGTRVNHLPRNRDLMVRIGPLAAHHSQRVAQLICERISYSPERATLEWCIEAAAGNPSHLDLLLRHSASERTTATPPPDLVALLMSRLEALPSPSRHVLQACVVFGTDCNPATIGALTGLDGYELLLTLEALVEAGIVTDNPDGIACRSSLIADRVRHSTTPVVRALLHRRAALFLEQTDATNASQATMWQIADHWQAAGNKTNALQWRRKCWQQLLSIGQPVAAAESIAQHLEQSSSDMESAELLDAMILAFQHAYDTRGQITALTKRSALSDRVGDNLAARLRIAADFADARLSNHEDMVSLLPELQTLLASEELDEMRRLRTAKVLMITADSLFDEHLARKAHLALPRRLHTLSAELLRDQVEAIYHASYGDLDVAASIAHRLETVACKLDLSPITIAGQITATLANHIAGRLPASTDNLEQLFQRCLSASMHDAAMRTSVRIGSISFDAGLVDTASYWFKRATQLIAEGGIERPGGDYWSLQLDLALEHGDFAIARSAIDIMPQQTPVNSSARAAREYLVYRVYVELSAGGMASEADIQRLINWHQRVKHLGRHDDHMQVVWMALWRSGRCTEASDLLRDYMLISRRERRPYGPAFRSRTAADEIWTELSATDEAPLRSARLRAIPVGRTGALDFFEADDHPMRAAQQ